MLYWVSSMMVRKSVTALIYLILIYLRVLIFSTYMWIMKSIHCQIIAMSTSILSSLLYNIHDMCSFCLLLFAPFTSPAAVSINISCFCTEKVTTKCDVVGCHIGQWPSSTNWNRYTIPVDCCVNAFLPLLSSMGSFTAKMVVLRRVCEVPTLRQKMFPCWFYPPSTPK